MAKLDSLRDWHLPQFSLDAAGVVALADLTSVARRTVYTGTSCLLDAFVICPGLHRQQNAVELNAGEYPYCADMETEWVFRIENPATVLYLQKVGLTGCVTTLSVRKAKNRRTLWQQVSHIVYDAEAESLCATIAYFLAASLCFVIFGLLIHLEDWWAVLAIALLVLTRVMNVVVIRRRAQPGWSGAPDMGKRDLLILVSQDRWIRMQGKAEDIKAVTAGQWLRQPTFAEEVVTAMGTLLVYLNATVAGNAKLEGKFLLLILLFGSVALLGFVNAQNEVLKLHGRLVRKEACTREFYRRIDMADMLIYEHQGKKAWAERLGLKYTESKDTAEASHASSAEAVPLQTLIRQRTLRGGQMV